MLILELLSEPSLSFRVLVSGFPPLPNTLEAWLPNKVKEFVYYEEIKEIKRELNRILIYECRCNERLRAKAEGCTRLAYTGLQEAQRRQG
jgi:hypothetical protein